MAKKSLVTSAAILGVAGIIVKILGACFRIPLTNWIGAEGMANYAPAYAVYSVLLVISTAGLPVATSKMVAERCAVGQFREAHRVFRISLILMTALGVAGALVVMLCAGPIAEFEKVPGSSLALMACAPALILVPIMSAYRGYFQGQQNMNPTAISQVIEQIFRVGCGLALAYYMMNASVLSAAYDPGARGAAGGTFGATAGGVGGLITMLIIFSMNKKEIYDRMARDVTTARESVKEILKKIIIIAIPITLGASLLPIMNAIDAAIVNRRLIFTGWSMDAAHELYGQITSMADPIVGFPQVLMQAIIVSIVPMVAAAKRLDDMEEVKNTINIGLRMTTIIGFPCAVGLFVLAQQALLLLYPLQRESAISATPCLQVLAIGFIFLSLTTTLTGVLQGLGKQMWPVINLAIGIAIKLILTWVLVGIHSLNIVGAALGTLCAYLIAAFLDYRCAKKFTGVTVSVKQTVIKPFLSALAMGIVVFAAYKVVFMILGSNTLSTLVAILVGVCVYGVLIIKTHAIRRDELLEISLGRKIVRLCDKLHLW
ncbi:MAG: polysaccharide biosynthesis protein [Bacillota bacterium]|nr:polysaccharide biosynthesis protein [Bacillota bacterium]